MLIGDFLQKNAQEQPKRPFIKIEKETYTFFEINKIVDQTVYLLQRKYDITKGSHISIVLPNSIDFLILFFAIAKIGGVVVPINPDFKSDMLSYIVKQSKSELLIQHYNSETTITDTAVTKLVINDNDILKLTNNLPTQNYEKEKISANDIFSIIYTSGTTSKPKGVVNTQNVYLTAGKEMSESLQINKENIIYLFLPLFHANPQFYGIMPALVSGSPLLIDKKFSASEFWKKAYSNEFNIFTYVGTVLSILAKTIQTNSLFTSIRGVGGGAPKEVWELITEKSGIKIHELYGMSETGGFVTINSKKHWKFDSVGKPRKSIEINILNENDERCDVNEIGEIAIRPKEPYVIFNGYYEDPQKTLEAFNNLWFHTGDSGWIDKSGFLHFNARSDDIIRKKGENISPGYIEEVFLRIPEVIEVACVGIDDATFGDEIKLCIIINKNDFCIQQLIDWGENFLPTIMVPRYFERFKGFPKTATEKVEKHKLKYVNDNVIDITLIKE